MKHFFRSCVDFLQFLAYRLAKQRLLQVASSLTYTTLLALIPVMTIILSVISVFPGMGKLGMHFKNLLLSSVIPDSAGKLATAYLHQFMENAGRLTVLGVILLCVTALMLMRTIENAFNGIWRVHNSRSWIQQGLAYWTVLTLGPLILCGFLLVGRLAFQLLHWSEIGLINVVEMISGLGLTVFLLTLLYRFVPNRFVPIQHALIGALVTGVLLEVGKVLFGLYITRVASYKLVYGAFASVPIFLIWLYCLWLIILAGAVLTASLSYFKGGAWRSSFDAQEHFLNAIDLLLLLEGAQQTGTTRRLSQLRQNVNMGYDDLGWMLDKLARKGYVQCNRQGEWLLGRALNQIKIADIFELFVYRLRHSPGSGIVAQEMDKLMLPTIDILQHTSLEVFAKRCQVD